MGINFPQIQGPHPWTKAFPTERSLQSIYRLKWSQIIEKLYAKILHTPRDYVPGARIFQQKTVLISCTSATFSVLSIHAPSFCAQFLNNR